MIKKTFGAFIFFTILATRLFAQTSVLVTATDPGTAVRDKTVGDSTNHALRVNCIVGCSSSGGSSQTDEATFTYGTTAFTAIGCAFNNTVTSLTSGQAGVASCSAKRTLKITLLDGSDAAFFTSGNAGYVQFPSAQTVTANAGTNLNTSALALDTSVNGLLVTQGSTTSGQKGTLHQGAVTTNAPSYTTAQTSPLSLDTSGLLRVSVKDTPANNNAFTIQGNLTNNNAAPGAHQVPVMPCLVNTAAPTYSDGNQALVSCFTDGSARVTVMNGSAVDANTYAITGTGSTATTTAGTSTCYLTTAASTNSTNCKNAAGNVYGIYIINTTTTNYFLRMYNASSAPTCSSATGFVETVPALGAAANGSGISRMQMAQAYGTGIGFCFTGGGSSTDNTNAATGVYVTILYK